MSRAGRRGVKSCREWASPQFCGWLDSRKCQVRRGGSGSGSGLQSQNIPDTTPSHKIKAQIRLKNKRTSKIRRAKQELNEARKVMKMIQVPTGHLNKQPRRPKPPKPPGSRPLMSRVPVHEIKNNKKRKKKNRVERGKKREIKEKTKSQSTKRNHLHQSAYSIHRTPTNTFLLSALSDGRDAAMETGKPNPCQGCEGGRPPLHPGHPPPGPIDELGCEA